MRKKIFRHLVCFILISFAFGFTNLVSASNEQFWPVLPETFSQQLYTYSDSAGYQKHLLDQITSSWKQLMPQIDKFENFSAQLRDDKQQQTIKQTPFNPSNLNSYYSPSSYYHPSTYSLPILYSLQNNFDYLTREPYLSNTIPKISYSNFSSPDYDSLGFQNWYNSLPYLSYLNQPQPGSNPIIAKSIRLAPTHITFHFIGQTKSITANLIYSDKSDELLTSGVNFDSMDPNVVSVDDGGLVSAVGEGITTITVNYGNLSAKIKVTVVLPTSYDIFSISIEPNTITLTSCGQTEQLTIRLNYELIFSDMSTEILELKLKTVGSVNFISSDPNVASVNSYGKVTAISDGEAIITATQDGLSGSAYVTVSSSKIVIHSLNASPTFVGQNEQTTVECLATSLNQEATLTYQWAFDGEILPESEACIIWGAPDITGTYKLCCKVSDNYGYEDTRCIKISVFNLNDNNLPYIKEDLYRIKAGEYFILTDPKFRIIAPEPDNSPFFFSCNVGDVGLIDDDVFVYLFKPEFPGYYLIQITIYNIISGAATFEFPLHVTPWWAMN